MVADKCEVWSRISSRPDRHRGCGGAKLLDQRRTPLLIRNGSRRLLRTRAATQVIHTPSCLRSRYDSVSRKPLSRSDLRTARGVSLESLKDATGLSRGISQLT